MQAGIHANEGTDTRAHKHVYVCYSLHGGIIHQLIHGMGAAASFSRNIFKVQEIYDWLIGRIFRFYSVLSRNQHGFTELAKHSHHQ